MWCIIVNRKLSAPTVYGPFEDYMMACDIDIALQDLSTVKTTMVVPLSEIRLEDGKLISTAYL